MNTELDCPLNHILTKLKLVDRSFHFLLTKMSESCEFYLLFLYFIFIILKPLVVPFMGFTTTTGLFYNIFGDVLFYFF